MRLTCEYGSLPGTTPGIDKPTWRVVALIVLLILVAAALRGYLPGRDHSMRSEAGSGRAALTFIIVILAAGTSLLAVAVIARLRDPRTVAPSAGDLSDMLGGGRVRPSWRVLLIGLALIVAWLLTATLLAHLFVPHNVGAPAVTPDPTPPPSASGNVPPAKQPAQDHGRDVFRALVASAVPLVFILVAGAVLTSRRRRTTPGALLEEADGGESPAPPTHSESLARAAEVGLAEIADPRREPREAIIACYAAMERELANVPGAAPQDFDTPTEVLARAVEHHVLHVDNAAQLVNLFAEARFSPHVMNEGHRDVAVRVLQLVLDELRPNMTPSGSA